MNSLPDWYWNKGLHDAEIKKISFQTLDYDYTQDNPIRNCLLVELDSRNALFDTKVTSIKFYNAKVNTGVIDVSGYWWVDDELSCNNKKYKLVIYIRNANEKASIQILFDSADILRCS